MVDLDTLSNNFFFLLKIREVINIVWQICERRAVTLKWQKIKVIKIYLSFAHEYHTLKGQWNLYSNILHYFSL